MIILARDITFGELLPRLTGKRVLLWTCNTCSRLCNGMGGDEAMERLAGRLREAGVDVVGRLSTSAACVETKAVRAKEEGVPEADIMLSLTCPEGARTVSGVFGIQYICPFVVLGNGRLSTDRVALLPDGDGYISLEEAAERRGLHSTPLL